MALYLHSVSICIETQFWNAFNKYSQPPSFQLMSCDLPKVTDSDATLGGQHFPLEPLTHFDANKGKTQKKGTSLSRRGKKWGEQNQGTSSWI